MISSRMVAERKAFSAAEAGAHAVFASIDLDNPYASITSKPVYVDPLKDSTVTYSVDIINTGRQTMMPGFSLLSISPVFEAVITGRDSIYGSEVRLSIGLAPPPSTGDTRNE